jgi:hypothetical protein
VRSVHAADTFLPLEVLDTVIIIHQRLTSKREEADSRSPASEEMKIMDRVKIAR